MPFFGKKKEAPTFWEDTEECQCYYFYEDQYQGDYQGGNWELQEGYLIEMDQEEEQSNQENDKAYSPPNPVDKTLRFYDLVPVSDGMLHKKGPLFGVCNSPSPSNIAIELFGNEQSRGLTTLKEENVMDEPNYIFRCPIEEQLRTLCWKPDEKKIRKSKKGLDPTARLKLVDIRSNDVFATLVPRRLAQFERGGPFRSQADLYIRQAVVKEAQLLIYMTANAVRKYWTQSPWPRSIGFNYHTEEGVERREMNFWTPGNKPDLLWKQKQPEDEKSEDEESDEEDSEADDSEADDSDDVSDSETGDSDEEDESDGDESVDKKSKKNKKSKKREREKKKKTKKTKKDKKKKKKKKEEIKKQEKEKEKQEKKRRERKRRERKERKEQLEAREELLQAREMGEPSSEEEAVGEVVEEAGWL
ncbi:hypothetical protein N7462_004758 [Penicillium macrosclerotiorum]|uniref:uncharacterized protein n=1 Tax=Penicillium macrosclerotiorum TaxID=303699 RepID=UPI002546FDB0|nr:uncharacterized protein N7462_004758 [Penicillium macrosclerotiorum]KAJ5690366.1 hypothetical protein N7462_004758 [Penicillium macrosclerotiorum]